MPPLPPLTLDRIAPSVAPFDPRPRAVERWLRLLPRGDVAETARLLLLALHSVNHQSLGWQQRHTFLLSLREAINYTQQMLIHQFRTIPFPLPDRHWQTARLAIDLHSAIAFGYHAVIRDLLSSRLQHRRQPLLARLLLLGLYHHTQRLILSYQIYSPPPQHCWHDLHTLYQTALVRSISEIQVTLDTDGQITTLQRYYKQTLLLALASPYRLRQGEIDQIYRHISKWVEWVEILPAESQVEALFVIHSQLDEPPDYQVFSRHPCHHDCLRLHTLPLATQLLTWLQGSKPDALRDLDDSLLRRLIIAWGIAPRRLFNRYPASGHCEIVVGITAIHQHLAYAHGLHHLALRSRSQFDDEQNTAAQAPEEMAKSHNLWAIRNQSASGYRLAIPINHPATVHVGELLALRPEGERGSWQIGIVRWLRQMDITNLEMGVQILAARGIPLMIRRNEEQITHRALLLPPVAPMQQPATLLLPIRLFAPLQEITVTINQHHHLILLENIILDSGAFLQFTFSHLVNLSQEASVPDADPFASLWQNPTFSSAQGAS
jgi:cyclic-di-GMP-binding protein